MEVEIIIKGYSERGIEYDIFQGEILAVLISQLIFEQKEANPHCVRFVVDIAFPVI